MALEPVILGGLQQWVMLEGKANGPVLVYLHGGPGAAELALAEKSQGPLRQDWLVVNWDQRGSGKSRTWNVSLECLIRDTVELVTILKTRYPGQGLFLLGHSWGSLLGLITLQRYPKLCDGFISIGQLVAGTENELLSHELATKRAFARGFHLLGSALLADHPPYGARADALLRKCFYLYLLGGFFRRRRALGLLLRLLRSRTYTVAEKVLYLPRFRASLKQLQPTIETLNLLASPVRLSVPALFCIGQRDLVTPPHLARQLFEHLEAPYKHLEMFEEDAHCLHYEHPERFACVLRSWLATVTKILPSPSLETL